MMVCDASGSRVNLYNACTGLSDPYEPSIGSSEPSSQASVFSDVISAQSSIATSFSDDFRNNHDDARDRDDVCAQIQLRSQAQHGILAAEGSCPLQKLLKSDCTAAPTYADVTSVPPQQLQNPRRSSASIGQKPPSLVRQRDRKINFVDNLVDSATQMVEVIWPMSAVPNRSGTNNGRGVLPLRTYIEETLRRSRTSYSTLQVTLYYLVLIKPHVPGVEMSVEQRIECSASSALMCGRRVFLAALILASKYLQDRNYSAKAWSKMSGLKITEINANERIFLNKINWKLHIPKPTFEKWQEVVLRFTPHPPPMQEAITPQGESAWKRIVPLLTPELDTLPPADGKTAVELASLSATCVFGSVAPASLMRSDRDQVRDATTSHESTPTQMRVLGRCGERPHEPLPPTPALARLGPLPTPNMTPSSVASNTPAVSVCNSRRTSITSAMAMIQKASLNRCLVDVCPGSIPSDARCDLSRGPSLALSVSSGSSPESLIFDYTRSSRSSSVSSVSTVSTTSSMAPYRANLARRATCRNVRLHLPSPLKESAREGSATKPIIIDDEAGLVLSPEITDFSVSEKSMHMPHRHSKYAPHAPPALNTEKGRKRCRSRGFRRSELHEEVRFLLQESLDDAMDIDEPYHSSPSPAASYASTLLAGCNNVMNPKQAHVYASPLLRRDSARFAVQKEAGKKRTCCSSDNMSLSPMPCPGYGGNGRSS